MTEQHNALDLPRETIEAVARVIRTSKRPVVLTGAGVSKESGIPTFRDALEGLWAQYDPTELATPRGFQSNPKRVWDWYQYRRELLAEARPNPGHYALAELDTLLGKPVPVITQNIDGLHQQAGSADVLPVHGDIRKDKCFANCQGNPTYVDIMTLEWDPDNGPPQCPHCGAYVRPDVVWYEENLPPALIQRAVLLARTCDVMLVIGTSGATYPVAHLPVDAYRRDATVIEINPDMTPISAAATHILRGPSGQVLPLVVAAIKAQIAAENAPESPDA